MNKEKPEEQTLNKDRLFTVANLEETDSGQKLIAWFFETPQVFELSLGTAESQQNFDFLKEAKEKQLPVTVRSNATDLKNIIEKVIPATETQINLYKIEKLKHQEPDRVRPPGQ